MRILLAALILSCGSVHADGFVLTNKHGQEVCRTQDGKAEQCMPTLKALGLPANDKIELIDELKSYSAFLEVQKADPKMEMTMEQLDVIGGAILFTPEEIKKLLSDYRRLSVRNLALDPRLATQRDGFVFIPFFGSVYWQGAMYTEGTLFVEGYIKLNQQEAMALNPDDATTLRKTFASLFQISGFSDSQTEAKMAPLRYLEMSARNIHFLKIGTEGKTVDEATTKLLGEIIGPMIVAEIGYIPMIKETAKAMADAFGRALEEELKKMLQEPVKPKGNSL